MLTEFLDLKLLVGTILPEPTKLEMDIDELLKKEEFNRLLRGEVKESKPIDKTNITIN